MLKESKRERITIRLTKRYMRLLDDLVERGAYNSRNEAIRDGLRLLFEHHSLKVLQGENSDRSDRSGRHYRSIE